MANEQHIQWLLEGVEAWNRRCESWPDHFISNPDFESASLYWIFQEADKLDQDDCIPLAGVDLGGANLAGTDLGSANLIGADLNEANLAGANLNSADLTDAKLVFTNLTEANLSFANLTNAQFMLSDLTDANLMSADLTKANFLEARLTRANLVLATLKGTFLDRADLTGAQLTASEPWKAVLYEPEPISLQQNNYKPNLVKDIESLLSEIQTIDSYYDETTTLYFRGEHENEWDLRPSIMRAFPTSKDSLHRFENEMLVHLMSSRPDEFNGTTSALAQWVLARHHSLQTRFLDITRNPLIALFHACDESNQRKEQRRDGLIHVFAVPRHLIKSFTSDTISVIANFARLSHFHQNLILGKNHQILETLTLSEKDYQVAMDLLYQFIRQEKPYFDESIDPKDFYRVFIVEPQRSSDRIRAQSAAFLVSAFHERFERDEICKMNPDIPVYAYYKLTISGACKEEIISNLRLLNITRETLFPGLDSSAEAITQSYRARL